MLLEQQKQVHHKQWLSPRARKSLLKPLTWRRAPGDKKEKTRTNNAGEGIIITENPSAPPLDDVNLFFLLFCFLPVQQLPSSYPSSFLCISTVCSL
jgi:hypothetical protein